MDIVSELVDYIDAEMRRVRHDMKHASEGWEIHRYEGNLETLQDIKDHLAQRCSDCNEQQHCCMVDRQAWYEA